MDRDSDRETAGTGIKTQTRTGTQKAITTDDKVTCHYPTTLLRTSKMSDHPKMSYDQIMIGRSLCRNFAHEYPPNVDDVDVIIYVEI
jgi:hypothetical protein